MSFWCPVLLVGGEPSPALRPRPAARGGSTGYEAPALDLGSIWRTKPDGEARPGRARGPPGPQPAGQRGSPVSQGWPGPWWWHSGSRGQCSCAPLVAFPCRVGQQSSPVLAITSPSAARSGAWSWDLPHPRGQGDKLRGCWSFESRLGAGSPQRPREQKQHQGCAPEVPYSRAQHPRTRNPNTCSAARSHTDPPLLQPPERWLNTAAPGLNTVSIDRAVGPAAPAVSEAPGTGEAGASKA